MEHKLKVGIIGGAGYTAGELIRLLLVHPYVELGFVQSTSQAGKFLFEVHTDLVGETDLRFSPDGTVDEIEVLFLCQGHGRAQTYLEANPIPSSVRIIDLSRDYRLKSVENPFVYGLPELNRTVIQQSSRIANPGCFATCIQLGLLPAASNGVLPEEVHIHAITGSTGAGQNPSPTTHFSWRNNNISVYKAFSHQHLGEIHQSLRQLDPQFQGELNFLPLRGDFPRGIHASIYFKTSLSLEEAQEMYQTYYASHPFVHLQATAASPHLKQVVNSNKCLLHLSKHGDKLLIISCIDNLLKGASGQAVQNLNLMMNWAETTGLRLKSLSF